MSAAAGAGAGSSRLTEVSPGAVVRVVEIDASVAGLRERLQAYGLAPGRELEVLQHAPVTVVRVERTDLAFEARVARGVIVSSGRAGSA